MRNRASRVRRDIRRRRKVMPTVRLQNTKSNWHTGDGDGQRRKILQFVLEFTRRQGYSPSYREIAEELGLAVSTVSYHVSVLKQEGSCAAKPGSRARSWRAPVPYPGLNPMGSRYHSSGRSRPTSPSKPRNWPRKPSSRRTS